MARSFVINDKLTARDKPRKHIMFSGMAYQPVSLSVHLLTTGTPNTNVIPMSPVCFGQKIVTTNYNICVNMLEIGTYHFTYTENCRVCCTAVFFGSAFCFARSVLNSMISGLFYIPAAQMRNRT